MPIEKFIRKYKELIDSVIRKHAPGIKIDNEERELWIWNDESLYNLAISKGVEL